MLRRIRHLHLTCVREEHATHGRVLLEDAMCTASFGDEGRLVLVRRLDLGRIPLRATATHWSRRLESAMQAARPVAVSFDDASANSAVAVFFANRYAPWLVLAERTVSGQPCTGWYWRLALPDWSPEFTAARSLRLCFTTLATLGGVSLTLILAQRLSAVLPLLQCLQPADLEPLRPELLATATARETGETDGTPLPPAWLAEDEAALVRQWGPLDLRTRWLAAAHLARARTGRSSCPATTPTPMEIHRTVKDWIALARPTVAVRSPLRPTAPDVSLADDRVATQGGGLLFVVPLLERSGLGTFLSACPAPDAEALPWRILHVFLRHARVSAEDPLSIATEVDVTVAAPLARWLIAANRHSLRLSTLSLRRLVARPALVSLSATHIDVFFRAAEADLRIRRAGLDVDPGWVPWLRRVVRFHYNRED